MDVPQLLLSVLGVFAVQTVPLNLNLLLFHWYDNYEEIWDALE